MSSLTPVHVVVGRGLREGLPWGLTDILWLIKSLGPTVGPALLVLGFFLWKDWRREDRLQRRVEKLEQEQKEVMLPMIEKCRG